MSGRAPATAAGPGDRTTGASRPPSGERATAEADRGARRTTKSRSRRGAGPANIGGRPTRGAGRPTRAAGQPARRTGRRPARRVGDRGSASIWAVGGIAVLFLFMAGVLAVGAVVQTRHRVTSAADLAALAAAYYAPDGEAAACARAHWVTDRMRVGLFRCRLSGWDALIEVSAPPPGGLRSFGVLAAHARAGPGDG